MSEFFLRDHNKIYFYDFVIRSKKIIIEYNGVLFHPKSENCDWIHTFDNNISCKEVYNKQLDKINVANNAGFKLLEAWSDDDKYEKCLEFIKKIFEMIVENFLELVDIEDISLYDEYVNMVDISVDVDQSFLLSNGLISHNSAISAFRKYRVPETMGAFALKGKFTNVSDISNTKLVNNSEAVNLMASLGLKLGKEPDLKDLRYGRILLYTDADCLEENTLVLTKNGGKKISNITYDDEIMTHTGEYKKVLNILEKDISNYLIIKVNGNTIICSSDHKLIVFRDGDVYEVSAKDIKYSDFLLLKDKN